jgi:hypothetical protein
MIFGRQTLGGVNFRDLRPFSGLLLRISLSRHVFQ